jgi:hypothetical protein
MYNATLTRLSLRTGNNHQSPVIHFEEFLFSEGDPAPLVEEVARYIHLHRSIFGTYEGELMPRPTPEVMAQLQGSMEDFMNRNGFRLLQRWLNLVTGYGYR